MPATETPREVAEMLDTGHYQHVVPGDAGPSLQAEYLRARAEIAQVDE